MESGVFKLSPLKSTIKQRKLGLSKQLSQSQIPQLQPNVNIQKNKTPNDDIKYLEQLAQHLLFNFKTAKKNKRVKSEHRLPPLTSSNNIDVKLYALFSLLLHNFVFGWYTNSLDLGSREEFTNELIFIFAHLCRNFQERINNSTDDFVKLLIMDLPYLFTEHFENLEEVSCILIKDRGLETNGIFSDDEYVEEWMQRFSNGLTDDDKLVTYRRLLVKSIVCLILPHENVESNISREFVTSLLDGVVLKNVIESFCDSFVIWDIIGKVSVKLHSTAKATKKPKSDDKLVRKKSTIHRILEAFIIEEKYEMKPENMLNFSEFIPLFSFINLITNFDLRFPLLITFFQIFFQLILSLNFLARFINNSIKRLIYGHVVNLTTVESIIDSLRHMMFPEDEKFEMKPRYVPQTAEELQSVYDENLKKLKAFLSSNSTISKVFISNGNAVNENFVDSKARYIMGCFKDRQINKILIQKIIDLLLSKMFPELQTQDNTNMYRIHSNDGV